MAAAVCAVAVESPRVISHRGGRAEYDDNAAGGFRKCLEAGVTGYETDIRMTKDLKLVIMHDGSVERTTEGKGTVEEMTFDEVTSLVLKRSREKSPSLQQVLDVFKGRSDVDIELEMKVDSKFYAGENMEIYCRKLHDAAVATLKPGTYTFTSFNRNGLKTMKRLFPDAPVGLIRSDALTKEFVDTAKSLGCCRVAPRMNGKKPGQVTTKEMVDYAHANGLKVTGWMVQNLPSWKVAKEAGCDCTTSDHPMALLKAIRESDAK
jgi:glycerophosphoryl diester phosphodiesterase